LETNPVVVSLTSVTRTTTVRLLTLRRVEPWTVWCSALTRAPYPPPLAVWNFDSVTATALGVVAGRSL
jgi:hypothetical protein